jgi:hypothetical protein
MASAAPLLGAEAPSAALAALLAVVPTVDPSLQAEVLNDMAHVALDLTTFFGPSKILLRCAMVVGRLFAMGADYVPDHFMLPEELAFQLVMLFVAWVGLLKAASPMALASMVSKITIRDGKSFSKLFEPAGMTWSQYKAMSFCALDWIEVGPRQVITSDEDSEDEYFYWLYSGDAVVENKGKVLYTVTRRNGRANSHDAGLGVFGEAQLLRKLDKNRKRTKDYPRTTVEAGPSGASLLRIHTANLSMLMDADQDMAHSIRTLLFQSMQDKLAAQYEA